MAESIKRIDLRKSHPMRYLMLMTLAVFKLEMAFNFWTSSPAFDPLGIDKNLAGVVFLVLGVTQLVFLNVIRDLDLLRWSSTFCVAWLLIWAGVNTDQFFNGPASLQVPITFVTLAILQALLMIEFPINPMTEKK